LYRQIFAVLSVLLFCGIARAETPPELRLGRASHAFDHLGDIGGQADAAAASGATIIYTGGLGEAGYLGLPPRSKFQSLCQSVSEYSRRAKANGIELTIGYLCATSMIGLNTFDKNWTPEFRAQFKTRPAEWRQQDRHGKPLASWYGGDYAPACMTNPDWRKYERAMVRYQLETGHDGVFFDNPTVHPQGCYCPYCMHAFADYLLEHASKPVDSAALGDVESIRKFADTHPREFLKFRTTIARDFLADMRAYARTINPRALITCNNSLNRPTVLYSQCRRYGYDIDEMSKAEDYVVVEDQYTQPRTDANGHTFEYGPTYKQLHAISHGKPIVAVTVANVDYHTPPHLMRLAMAEAAANNASYMSWPTWPVDRRQKMIAAVRPQTDFLRRNAALLNDAPMRADVVLFLPFQRWIDTDQCAASRLAAALTKANIQYVVVSEDDFAQPNVDGHRPVLLVESQAILSPGEQSAVSAYKRAGGHMVSADKPDWLKMVRTAIAQPSITVEGPPTVRAVVHDQPSRTIVHLYNLDIQRLSSYEDKVVPADNVRLVFSLNHRVRSANMYTADEKAKATPIKLEPLINSGDDTMVSIVVPRLEISAIVVVDR
jgi:hypothetical protein